MIEKKKKKKRGVQLVQFVIVHPLLQHSKFVCQDHGYKLLCSVPANYMILDSWYAILHKSMVSNISGIIHFWRMGGWFILWGPSLLKCYYGSLLPLFFSVKLFLSPNLQYDSWYADQKWKGNLCPSLCEDIANSTRRVFRRFQIYEGMVLITDHLKINSCYLKYE